MNTALAIIGIISAIVSAGAKVSASQKVDDAQKQQEEFAINERDIADKKQKEEFARSRMKTTLGVEPSMPNLPPKAPDLSAENTVGGVAGGVGALAKGLGQLSEQYGWDEQSTLDAGIGATPNMGASKPQPSYMQERPAPQEPMAFKQMARRQYIYGNR